MVNVRDKIELVFGKDGVLVKHPSGVEVLESKANVEQRIENLVQQAAALVAETARIRKDMLDKIDAASGTVIPERS